MKWVRLSERKPSFSRIDELRYWFTDGNESFLCTEDDEWIPYCTHWLEFDLPPLPLKTRSREEILRERLLGRIKLSDLDILFHIREILEILKTKADK